MVSGLYQHAPWIQLMISLACVLVRCSYLSVGDDLKVVCELSEHHLESYSAHNISFRVRYPHQNPSEARCLSMSSVSVLNRTTAILTIPNVTLQDSGQYTCHVGSSKCQTMENNAKLDSIVLSEDFIIEETPQNVTKLECVVNNWDESMTCQWRHPVNYSDWDPILVTCVYTVQYSSLEYPCPRQSYNGCSWSGGEFRSTPYYVLQVSVTNNRTKRTASTIFIIHTLKIVKPSPVEQLTAVEMPKGSGCVNVSWRHPRTNRPKVYRIHQQVTGDTQLSVSDALQQQVTGDTQLSVSDAPQQQVTGDTQLSVVSASTNETQVTSCGHKPHTHHRFSVQCFPASIWSGYWSDPVFTDAWTSMTAPSHGPRTTNGSFTSSECSDGSRNVTIMWQEVERRHQNGVIDGYILQHGETTLANVSAGNFSADIPLPCSSTSEIYVYAHNEGGYSLVPSVMIIPPVSFQVPVTIKDSFAVKIADNRTTNQTQSLVATWVETTTSANITYTIFWCRSQSSTTCQGKINWAVVKVHLTQQAIPLPVEHSTRYHFGISATSLDHELTSGIYWTPCLFHDNPRHVPVVGDLRVHGEERGVGLRWAPIPCTYQSQVKVTGYIVKWCQANCKVTYGVWVPATQCFYTVADLEESVPYQFTVQAVSYGTIGDEVWPWKPFIVPGSGTPIWLPILLGVAGVAGVSVWLFVCCFYRACKKGRDRLESIPKLQLLGSTSVQTTSEESLTIRTGSGGPSTGTSNGDGESRHSFDGGTSNNSRAFLITEPTHGERENGIFETNSGRASGRFPASAIQSPPEFLCTPQVRLGAVHIEPVLANNDIEREGSNREGAEACVD